MIEASMKSDILQLLQDHIEFPTLAIDLTGF